MRRVIFIFLFLLMSRFTWASEMSFLKILEVSGRAEVLSPGGKWQPLLLDTKLSGGNKIRTRVDSAVEIAFDSDWENILRIEADSRLDILNLSPLRVSLERGALFVIQEKNFISKNKSNKKTGALKVFTKFGTLESSVGGYVIESSKKGLWIKVYGDEQTIYGLKSDPHKVAEGFKLFLHGPSTYFLERMTYPDYLDWQAWVRKAYEKKDDFQAERIDL